MRLEVKIDGSMTGIMASQVRNGERAVSAAMRAAGASLKAAWRAEITGAGLGRRLANSIRDDVYPKGRPSLNAATLVWSKAPKIISAHERGALIRSASGFWLAIPTKAAGKTFRGKKITPGEWQFRTGIRLRFVHLGYAKAVLVADDARTHRATGYATKRKTFDARRNTTAVPIFILVPQVKLAKRIDLMSAAKAAHASLPSQIIAAWRGAR